MQGEIVSKWFRENLNEFTAEKELRTTRKGTFLVWRCRSPVDLYLSYLDNEGLVHHLPIKQLGRFYFLEGSKFCSLSELVVHHLTMREFSHNPVKIVNSHKREKLEATHIALVEMEYRLGQPAFCVYRGDLLSEIGRIDDRWLLAKHLPSESIAFFDLTQTSILSDMDAAPEALPYFHKCSGEDQEKLVQSLAESGRGSFLIRRSRQTAEAFSLLVHTGNKIDKFLIEEVKVSSPSSSFSNTTIGGWRLSGRIFPSISQIVHRYSIRPIQSEARLTHAILSPTPNDETRYGGCCTTSSPCTSTVDTSSTEEPASSREIQECGRSSGEAKSRNAVVVASVNALYKSREGKDWRACTVTLYEHPGTAILRIGDTSRCECNSLILQFCSLVCLHESAFSREATVFLSPLQSEPGGSIFLSFEPLHFYFTWFHLLRRYTVHRRLEDISPSFSCPISYYSTAGAETKEMSLLALHIDKYKGALLKTDSLYRMGISLNGVGVATTPYQTPTTGSGPSVIFDAHFLLIVTSFSCNVQFTLSASGKSRPTAVSSVTSVPVGSMTSLSPASSTTALGVERRPSNATAAMPFVVTATRHKVVVLSIEYYAFLIESLLDEVLCVAEWASGRLPVAQRTLLSATLVSLVWPHSLRALIERTLGKTLRGVESGENMLRRDSFATHLITAALRMSGKTVLEAMLEERPRKEAPSDEDWIVGLLSEVARIPAVSLILACVAATVTANLSPTDKDHVVRRAISATFVLRFANPLIISTLAASGGPALARGVQTAANAATMHSFVRDESGESTATRLFDLFERVRHSAAHTVMVEAYDRAPEQCSLLCHLLALAFSTNPPSCCHPATCSFSSSSSTVTTSSGSSMTSSTLCGTDATVIAEAELGLSSSLSTESSSSSTASHCHPELTPRLAALLERHRS